MAASIERERSLLPSNEVINLQTESRAPFTYVLACATVASLRQFGEIVRAALVGTAPAAPMVASAIALGTVAGSLNLFGFEPLSLWTALVDLLVGWAAIALVRAILGLTDVRRARCARSRLH